MNRYIDADKIEYEDMLSPRGAGNYEECQIAYRDQIDDIPTADVRKNVHAKKVIGGGERDGATCWFECSHCHGSVDLQDLFCKHCGAVLEYEK